MTVHTAHIRLRSIVFILFGILMRMFAIAADTHHQRIGRVRRMMAGIMAVIARRIGKHQREYKEKAYYDAFHAANDNSNNLSAQRKNIVEIYTDFYRNAVWVHYVNTVPKVPEIWSSGMGRTRGANWNVAS